MNFRSLVGCSLVLAAVAAQAADVVLTEDLVVTNQFVNPNADKPMPAQRTVNGIIGLNESPVVIEKADYRKIIPVYANGCNNINNATMHFYHRRVDEGASYVLYQAQCISGGFLKCVFVKFEQDGDDVKVTSPYQSYVATSNGLGYEFPESKTFSSYEIQDLTCLVMTDETYSYGACGASLPELSDDYSGAFGVRIQGPQADGIERTLSGILCNQKQDYSWFIIRNALYNEIQPLRAKFVQNGTVFQDDVSFWHFRDFGSHAEIQAQAYNGAYFKSTFIIFQQIGSDVLVTTGGADYSNTKTLGYDFRPVCENNTGVSDMVYTLGRPGVAKPEVTMSGNNTYTGATIVDNAKLTFAGSGNKLPAYDPNDPTSTKGVVIVTNGAQVVIDPSDGRGSGNMLKYHVSTKGTVMIKGTEYWPAPWNTYWEFDDAELNLAHSSDNLYINYLTLSNGALVSGNKTFRTCWNVTDTYFYSKGGASTTNEIAATVGMVGTWAETGKMNLHIVADADLKMAKITPNTYTERYMELIKEGERSLIINACGLNNYQYFRAKEGVLVLNSNLTASGPGLIIDGGTVVSGAGNANVMPKLSLGADGVLEVLADTSFTFNALGDGWDEGEGELLVKYADKDTSSVILPKLTASQRAHVRIQVADGKVRTVMQDESGRLIPTPPGLVLIVR